MMLCFHEFFTGTGDVLASRAESWERTPRAKAVPPATFGEESPCQQPRL